MTGAWSSLARSVKQASTCHYTPRRSVIALLTLLVATPVAAAGREEPTLGLDLERSVALARGHSLRLRDRADEIAAAEYRRRQARGRFLPRLSASLRYSRVSHVEPGTIQLPIEIPNQPPVPPVKLGEAVDDQVALRLQLEQPLFTGFALRHGYSAAQHGLELARHRRVLDEQELRVQVEEAYFGLKKARDTRAVMRQSVALLEAQLRRVRNLAEVGKATDLDVARVQTRLAAAQVSLVQVEGAVSTGHLALTTLLGVPSTTPLELTETVEPIAPAPASSNALLAQALRARPELAVSRAAAAMAEDRARVEASALYPQLAFRFGVSDDRPNQRYFPPQARFDTSWDASVVLTWTFWDFGVSYYGMKAAQREAAVARRGIEQTREAVTLDVERRRVGLLRETERVTAGRQGVTFAERAFRTAVELFEAGQATNVEVLDAETELTRARADLMQALADSRIARAQLRRAVGE